MHVAVLEVDVVDSGGTGVFPGPFEERGGDVDPESPTARGHPGRQLQRGPARSATQIDDALAGLRVQTVNGHAPGRADHLFVVGLERHPRRGPGRPEFGLLAVGERHNRTLSDGSGSRTPPDDADVSGDSR